MATLDPSCADTEVETQDDQDDSEDDSEEDDQADDQDDQAEIDTAGLDNTSDKSSPDKALSSDAQSSQSTQKPKPRKLRKPDKTRKTRSKPSKSNVHASTSTKKQSTDTTSKRKNAVPGHKSKRVKLPVRDSDSDEADTKSRHAKRREEQEDQEDQEEEDQEDQEERTMTMGVHNQDCQEGRQEGQEGKQAIQVANVSDEDVDIDNDDDLGEFGGVVTDNEPDELDKDGYLAPPVQADVVLAHASYTTYAQVVSCNAIKRRNAPFDVLKGALDAVYANFADIRPDTAVFSQCLTRLGCNVLLTGTDGDMTIHPPNVAGCKACEGREAILEGLRVMGTVVSNIYYGILASRDPRADMTQDMHFVDQELSIRLASLFVRLGVMTICLPKFYELVQRPAETMGGALNLAVRFFQDSSMVFNCIEGARQEMNRRKVADLAKLFVVLFTVRELALRGYALHGRLVYKQKFLPKMKPVPSVDPATQAETYPCTHLGANGRVCRLPWWKHTFEHVQDPHMFTCNMQEDPSVQVPTLYWEPVDDSDFEGLGAVTIANFIERTAAQNEQVDLYLRSNLRLATEVEDYLFKTRSSQVRHLVFRDVSFACWNGILDGTHFFEYGNLPEHLNDAVAVPKFFPCWYFHEEDDQAMRGAPCAEVLDSDVFKEVVRPKEFQFEGYVQNLYCTKCNRQKNGNMHNYCTNAKWDLVCLTCSKRVAPRKRCTCKAPQVYTFAFDRFLKIRSPIWDSLVLPQVELARTGSPADKTLRVELSQAEKERLYIWVTGMSFRPLFFVGPNALKTVAKRSGEPYVTLFTDNFRVYFVVEGPTGTGKTQLINLIIKLCTTHVTLNDEQLKDETFLWHGIMEPGTKKMRPAFIPELGAGAMRRTFLTQIADFPKARSVRMMREMPYAEVNVDRCLTIATNKFCLADGDEGGSAADRAVIIKFEARTAEDKRDNYLEMRALANPIGWIRKGISCYAYISQFGSQDFIRVCPPYFRETREAWKSSSNPMLKFLFDLDTNLQELGTLVVHPRMYILKSDLQKGFTNYLKNNNMPTNQPWRDDHADLKAFKIVLEERNNIVVNGNVVEGKFFRGIGSVVVSTPVGAYNKVLAQHMPEAPNAQTVADAVEDGSTDVKYILESMEQAFKTAKALAAKLSSAICDEPLAVTSKQDALNSMLSAFEQARQGIKDFQGLQDDLAPHQQQEEDQQQEQDHQDEEDNDDYRVYAEMHNGEPEPHGDGFFGSSTPRNASAYVLSAVRDDRDVRELMEAYEELSQ